MEWIITALVVLLGGWWYTYYIRKKYEKRFLEYQDKVVNRQVEEVREVYMTMRGWRHDYHNHMQKLKAHLEMNQIEEMREYLNLLESDLDRIQITYNTGNANLDAILNSKLSLAEKSEITINCKCEISSKISIEDTDLCILIGNLIDNGVEACQKLTYEKKKFIRIYMCIRKSQLYISVTNSTNEAIRKLDQEYVTNKRGNHGHGLKRIDNVVDKYGGYIKRANEPGVFTTEIMLPLEN